MGCTSGERSVGALCTGLLALWCCGAAKLDAPPCPGVGDDATVQASIAPGEKPVRATVRPKNFGALQKVPAVGRGGPITDGPDSVMCFCALRASAQSISMIRSRGQDAYIIPGV